MHQVLGSCSSCPVTLQLLQVDVWCLVDAVAAVSRVLVTILENPGTAATAAMGHHTSSCRVSCRTSGQLDVLHSLMISVSVVRKWYILFILLTVYNLQWTSVHDIQLNTYTESNSDEEETQSSASDTSQTVVRPRVIASPRRRIPLRTCNTSSSQATSRGLNQHSSSLSPTDPTQPLLPASPPFIMSVSVNNSAQNQALIGQNISGDSFDGDSDRTDREQGETDQDTDTSSSEESESPGSQSESEGPRTQSEPESPNRISVPQPQQEQGAVGGLSSLQAETSHSVTLGESVTFIIRSGAQVAERTLLLLGQNKPPDTNTFRIHENSSRLTYYTEEPNVGRGFIKEVNFSSDGRLIASPYGFGLRLLAFSPDCQELCDIESSREPRELYELTSNMSHNTPVVATKFSPTHCLLVTGCLSGKVDFHQPVL